jgi:hypothetical protein
MAGTAMAAPTSDLATMEKARALYAKGDLAKAVETYNQITPSSDFWLDSIEERAWAATRQGDFEKALADLQSITSAVWTSQVGPETYMLSTFVSLKICAYKDVVKKIGLFKKRMLPRVDALQAMVDQPLPAAFWEMSSALKEGKINMVSLGNGAEKYPRYFYRDQQLISALASNQNAKAEARMKQLAQADLSEIETNLKKMKVIEVELIQKVLMADDLKKSKSKNLQFTSVDRNKQLVFPVSDDEVWVDEVGHYQVKAENCPFSSRSSL